MAEQMKHVGTAVLAGGAVAAFAWMYAKSKTPSVTFDARAVSEAYDPYSHFLHSSPAGWVRHFPDTVGANCLPMAYQNEDRGLALVGVEATDGSYAQ